MTMFHSAPRLPLAFALVFAVSCTPATPSPANPTPAPATAASPAAPDESEAPAFAASDTGRTDIVIGTSMVMDSKIWQGPRTINISLPWGYDKRVGERFPVLYLIDGGVQQDFHPMAGMTALASLTRQYREFVLVGVQTENRYHELTAPSQVPADLESIPKNGGAARFRRHLLEEVKPYIEARYRTSGEDAIIGESLAGLFIAETFLRAPGSFTHYVAVSPSLWWRDMGLAKETASLLARGGFAGRSLFLTVADEGGTMQEGIERVVAALRAAAPVGLIWWYEPMAGEHHHTIYNPATLQALRRIFAPPSEK